MVRKLYVEMRSNCEVRSVIAPEFESIMISKILYTNVSQHIPIIEKLIKHIDVDVEVNVDIDVCQCSRKNKL